MKYSLHGRLLVKILAPDFARGYASILVAAIFLIGSLRAADYPQAEISNGQIRATLNLPDAQKGYRGTRFDWSGVIAHLEYAGHTF